ncbi:hypothetical protein Peur_050779 [Populus x canadensis]
MHEEVKNFTTNKHKCPVKNSFKKAQQPMNCLKPARAKYIDHLVLVALPCSVQIESDAMLVTIVAADLRGVIFFVQSSK